VCCQGPHILG